MFDSIGHPPVTSRDDPHSVGDGVAISDQAPSEQWLQPEWALEESEPPLTTETPAAPAGLDPQLVGERLRRSRRRQGLTIRQLAARVEVSPSTISQIETGKTQPSVRTLYGIVNELGVSLDEIFMPDKIESPSRQLGREATVAALGDVHVERAISRDRVQRAGHRQIIELESGVKWELLATSHDPDIDFIHHIYPVGGSSGPAGVLMRHSGREFGIVLSGRLGVTVGFDQYILLPGDSILFDSTTPHRLFNDGDDEVHSIWVIYGRNPQNP
jgi:transcriptional regulator with XRE-family HTH domain